MDIRDLQQTVRVETSGWRSSEIGLVALIVWSAIIACWIVLANNHAPAFAQECMELAAVVIVAWTAQRTFVKVAQLVMRGLVACEAAKKG